MQTFKLERSRTFLADDAPDYIYEGRLALCGPFVKRFLKKCPEIITVTISSKPFEGCRRVKVKYDDNNDMRWSPNVTCKKPVGDIFPAVYKYIKTELGQGPFETLLYFKIT